MYHLLVRNSINTTCRSQVTICHAWYLQSSIPHAKALWVLNYLLVSFRYSVFASDAVHSNNARYFSSSRGSQPYTVLIDSTSSTSEIYLFHSNSSMLTFFSRCVLRFGLGAKIKTIALAYRYRSGFPINKTPGVA